MVAYIDLYDDAKNPKTLSEWVRNFRLKKIQMKRKLRGAGSDLRVAAILSTALLSAEHELRRKQQERFSRWLEIQAKFAPKCSLPTPQYGLMEQEREEEMEAAALEYKRQREMENNLWKCELSGLDDFMRSLSSSSNNNNSNHNCNSQRAIAVNS